MAKLQPCPSYSGRRDRINSVPPPPFGQATPNLLPLSKGQRVTEWEGLGLEPMEEPGTPQACSDVDSGGGGGSPSEGSTTSEEVDVRSMTDSDDYSTGVSGQFMSDSEDFSTDVSDNPRKRCRAGKQGALTGP